MKAIKIELHPDNPQPHKISQIVDCLKDGGVVVYPTDTVYAIGCDLFASKAINSLRLIKQEKSKHIKFSFLCEDLSNISKYARISDNTLYKLMKKTLPGPYTYILPTSSKFPKIFKEKKKQVGIRVPNHMITKKIIELLGNPIISSSIKCEGETYEYITDPEEIYDKYHKLVDMVVVAGNGRNTPSTVVDCTTDGEFHVIREGLGDVSMFY